MCFWLGEALNMSPGFPRRLMLRCFVWLSGVAEATPFQSAGLIRGSLEVEEFFAEGVFVCLFGGSGFAASGVFEEGGMFPGIDLGYRMVNRGQSFFRADGGDPFVDSGFVFRLHCIQSCGFYGHVFLAPSY